MWEMHSGNYSAESGIIGYSNYESTTLRVRLDCISGNITFYRKVSSDLNVFLIFCIDGEEKGRWSGEDDWTMMSFPVTAGRRIFEWTYSKYYGRSSGWDAAWIDDIVFPVDCSNWPPSP